MVLIRQLTLALVFAAVVASPRAHAVEDCRKTFAASENGGRGTVATSARNIPATITKDKLDPELVNDLLKRLDEAHTALAQRYSTDKTIGRSLMFSQTRTELDRLSFDLSQAPKDGKYPLTLLGKIRRIIINSQFRNEKFAYAWINEILEAATNSLATKKLSDDAVSRFYITIELARGYVQSFVKVAPVDRDGQVEEKKEEPPKKPEPKPKKKKGPPKKPTYPELPEDYKPHTKDTDSDESDSTPPFVVAEFNGKTAYFKQRQFNEVVRGAETPFKKGIIPLLNNQIAAHRASAHHLKIEMLDKKEVSIMIPPGYQPLASANKSYTLQRNETGTYRVSSNNPNVEIPLIEENEQLTDLQKEYLSQPIGFKITEWPPEMKADLIDHLRGLSSLAQNEMIEHYLRTKYLYSVDAKDPSDPIPALKQGAFQCDIAAYTMTALVRDILKLPARPVGGDRAKSKADGSSSYAVLPGEAHAWVEVYIDGKWHTFDPTPVKKIAPRKTKRSRQNIGPISWIVLNMTKIRNNCLQKSRQRKLRKIPINAFRK